MKDGFVSVACGTPPLRLADCDYNAEQTFTMMRSAEQAGAKVLAQRLQEKAPVDMGELRDSIKPGPVKYSAADGYYCEVKPVGNHSGTGEPLAKIGNVLEYGRSYGATKKAGLGWFHPTVKAAEGEVLAKIQAEFEKAQK